MLRSAKKYGYENLITREMQFEKPTEEDEDEEDEIEEIPVKNSPPPLPPAPPEEESKPPLPPPEVPSFAGKIFVEKLLKRSQRVVKN